MRKALGGRADLPNDSKSTVEGNCQKVFGVSGQSKDNEECCWNEEVLAKEKCDSHKEK